MTESKEKYVHFRNFMANELKITRCDIESWTKEAVAAEVSKIVGQIDILGIVNRHASSLTHNSYRDIKESIAKTLSEKIILRLND